MRSRFKPTGVVEVEILERLRAGRRAARMQALTAVGLPREDLELQACDQELLVGPILRTGPFGQPGNGLAQRWRGRSRVKNRVAECGLASSRRAQVDFQSMRMSSGLK
jgi:hypothetical protein